MASSYDKSVKGGTKIKLAPPKSKYVQHILQATHAGEHGVAEVFSTLQNRIRDSTWTISFKALIIVHLMIREGEPNVTLKYLSKSPQALAVNNYTDIQTQGQNIRCYSQYLIERARSYYRTKVDYVQAGEGRLKKLTIDKGLLRETESVQDVIQALLQCEMFTNEPENEITLTAYRLLTMDLMVIFNVMNEATINVLEHFFEMSKPDAERALVIYRTFARQTDSVVRFLGVARQYESGTRLEIPKLKHAPTTLANSLQDYVNDPDFDINRRQFLAQKEAKRTGKPAASVSSARPTGESSARIGATTQSISGQPALSTTTAKPQPKGPAPDLIDFFDSIEQYQQPMGTYHQGQTQYPQQTSFPLQQTGFVAQQTGFQPQPQQAPFLQESFTATPASSTNPFGQPFQQQPQQSIQPQYTGAGFGGYTPQPQQQSPYDSQQTSLSSIPQNGMASFTPFPQQSQPSQQTFSSTPSEPIQPQATNPFRQSTMTPQATAASQQTRSASNPFARQASPAMQQTSFQTSFSSPALQQTTQPSPFPLPQQQQSPFPQQQPQSQPQPQQFQPHPQPIASQPTGSNPFARTASPQAPSSQFPQQSAAAGLVPNVTGSTNPFRQSAFVNQATGQGWQHGPQGTMGGFERLETQPVFPRPGQMF